MANWTDERKAEAVEAYTKAEPTPENTMEIVEGIAEEMGETVNGVRIILSKAGVYIPKKKAASGSTTASGDAPKRKPKQESLDELTALMEEHGVEVDEAIVGKLTGKAAEFFISAFKHIIEG